MNMPLRWGLGFFAGILAGNLVWWYVLESPSAQFFTTGWWQTWAAAYGVAVTAVVIGIILLGYSRQRSEQETAVRIGGVIKADEDPPGISRDAWLRLIESRPELVRPSPREGVNPFTGEPTVFKPSPYAARLIVGGEELGLFHWAQNEENALLVDGDIEAMRPYAEDLAKELGGTLETAVY